MDPVLIGLALGLILIQVLHVSISFHHLLAGRVFVCLLLAVVFYLVHPTLSSPWLDIADAFRTAIPGLFWLLCQTAFSDRFKWQSLGVLGVLFTVVAPSLLLPLSSSTWSVNLFQTLPQMVEFSLIVHGLYTVIVHWSDDLVEQRRRLRLAMVLLSGISVLALVIIELWFQGTRLLSLAITCGALLSTSFVLLQGREGVLYGFPGNAQPVALRDQALVIAKPSDEQVQLDALQAVIDSGFVKTEGINLEQFASQVGLPVHRVRQLINQKLGFRNFPDFINQYRIEEAKQRLLAEPTTPVLNIALDIGYRSVSSFNRVFKEHTQCSPSEFRKAKQNTLSESQ